MGLSASEQAVFRSISWYVCMYVLYVLSAPAAPKSKWMASRGLGWLTALALVKAAMCFRFGENVPFPMLSGQANEW